MRTWPGLAAIGAGLIHLGSAAGTAPAVLVPLALLGAAEVLWGVGALARPEPPFPRAAAVAVAVAVVLGSVGLLLPAAAARHGGMVDLGVPGGAFGGAGALDLVLAVLLAIRLVPGRPEAAEPRPVRFLIAAGLAAAVVAIVTTESLAATSVGGPMRMH
ncbi:hypothetical protein [Amnibacterium sp.]|uniref:hypothetical protein n=1 Tax=Amnibacterium sp. TaxID=1872496 RepID=UPI003F7BEB6D